MNDAEQPDKAPTKGQSTALDTDWADGIGAQPIADMSGLATVPPVMAAALVACQAAGITVVNDGWNSHQKYKYATAAAIVDAARGALAIGKLALLRIETRLVPITQKFGNFEGQQPYGTVVAKYRLIHESGVSVEIVGSLDCYPRKSSPTDKAKAAALTMIDKYVRTGVCGLSWRDPSEDVDQRPDHGHQGRGQQQDRGQQQQPQAQQQSQPPKPKPTPKVHPNPVYQALLESVRKIFGESKVEPDRLWSVATGESRMPSVKDPQPHNLPPHALRAVELCVRNCGKLEEANAAPERWTHRSYIDACESNEFEFPMIDGASNTLGDEVDAMVLAAQPKAGG